MRKHTIKWWFICTAAMLAAGGLTACDTSSVNSSTDLSVSTSDSLSEISSVDLTSSDISSSSEMEEITLVGFENTEESVVLG